jgi:hypothetical protein
MHMLGRMPVEALNNSSMRAISFHGEGKQHPDGSDGIEEADLLLVRR